MGSPVPLSGGTSRTQVSLMRSRMRSSVMSGKPLGPEADGSWPPWGEGGPQPNEPASSRSAARKAIRNIVLGTFRTCSVGRKADGNNSSARISFILFARIADLHSAYVQARQEQHDAGEQKKARHRDPGGRRFDEDGERAFGHSHGHERLQVVDDAYLFQPRRQQKVYPFPAVEEQARDDRVAETQPDDQEHRPVPDAREYRYAEIGQQMACTCAAEKVFRGLGREESEVKQQYRSDRRDAEQHNSRDEPGQIFAEDQDLTPDRREEVVMQAPVHHLAAEQVHEDPRAAEEYERAQDEPAVHRRVDLAQRAEVLHLVGGRRKQREHGQQKER